MFEKVALLLEGHSQEFDPLGMLTFVEREGATVHSLPSSLKLWLGCSFSCSCS
jgi:hypothetical protein